jgi:cell wall assembly regulator SMI1
VAIKNVLERLTKWCTQNAPDIAESLNPGATPAEIAQFRTTTKLTVPPDWTELYAWHNGQSEEAQGLFYGLRFLPLEQVLADIELWADLVDMNEEMQDSMSSKPDGCIKKLYANPKWIPLTTDYGGNHIGIDLDPDVRGRVGQVIVFGRDEDEKKLAASSLSEFLELITKQLESGNFLVDEDDFSLKRDFAGGSLNGNYGHLHNAFPIKGGAK